MRLVRTVGTGPELRLRSALFRRGLRYRLSKRPLPIGRCRPDLLFPGAMVAVFVDGCFWHGCPEHPSWPKSNGDWWRQKIEGNCIRDSALTTALTDAGWFVVRVWEHEELAAAVDRIHAAVCQRRLLRHPATRTTVGAPNC
jgi:DNA mismatch endonuclease (patch repair protein)